MQRGRTNARLVNLQVLRLRRDILDAQQAHFCVADRHRPKVDLGRRVELFESQHGHVVMALDGGGGALCARAIDRASARRIREHVGEELGAHRCSTLRVCDGPAG